MREKKRSTIVTIAKELGVAPSTVSRAFEPTSRISSEVREKVLKCAAGHGYIPNRAAARLSMKEITVGVLMGNSYAQGEKEMLRGIDDAFRSLYDYKLVVEIKNFTPGESEKTELPGVLAELEGCDGLIVCGVISAGGAEVLSEYAVRHPALVLLQSDIKNINRLFLSAHDPAASAVMAAEFLSCCLRNTGKRVMFFTGNRESQIHAGAVEAFSAAADRLGLEIVASEDMKDSPELLARQAAELLRPGAADGIYITSGKSLELCRAVKAMSARPVLVTFDTYPELNGYISDGTVAATIYQNLYSQAFKAFTLLIKYLVEGQRPPKVVSPIPELVLPCALPYYTDVTEKRPARI